MGTNYYMTIPATCEPRCSAHCRDEELHLGKSSMGWSFTFQAYPEREPAVTDFASWKALLSLGQIRDEYGSDITADELLAFVEARRSEHSELFGTDFYDADRNRFVVSDFS